MNNDDIYHIMEFVEHPGEQQRKAGEFCDGFIKSNRDPEWIGFKQATTRLPLEN